MAPVGGCGNELYELSDLRLSYRTRTEWVVQHHGKELNKSPVAFDRDGQHLADSRIVVSPQLASLDDRQRPAGDQPDARNPIVLLPVADEQVMFHAEPLGYEFGLRYSRRSTRTRTGRQCRDSPRPVTLQ